MTVVSLTAHLPTALWRAVQALASHDGDPNTVILRALEEYITATAKRRGHRSGKYRKLVQALSMPVADLHLSARPASALRTLNIKYVYELVQKTPTDLFGLPNLGEKSLREVKAKLATLGLSLGMTVDDESYTASVLETVAARIAATPERAPGPPPALSPLIPRRTQQMSRRPLWKTDAEPAGSASSEGVTRTGRSVPLKENPQ